jgi:hypothetical protein
MATLTTTLYAFPHTIKQSSTLLFLPLSSVPTSTCEYYTDVLHFILPLYVFPQTTEQSSTFLYCPSYAFPQTDV